MHEPQAKVGAEQWPTDLGRSGVLEHAVDKEPRGDNDLLRPTRNPGRSVLGSYAAANMQAVRPRLFVCLFIRVYKAKLTLFLK